MSREEKFLELCHKLKWYVSMDHWTARQMAEYKPESKSGDAVVEIEFHYKFGQKIYNGDFVEKFDSFTEATQYSFIKYLESQLKKYSSCPDWQKIRQTNLRNARAAGKKV